MRPTLGLLLAFLAAAAVADDGGDWVPLSAMGLARQETGAARIGDRVYVVGGLLANGVTRSVEAYTISLDRWEEVAPLPQPLDHMGVAAVGGKLYVTGGFSGDFRPRDEVWVYDPASDVWSAAAPLPERRGAHWSVALDGRIYVVGGMDGAGVARATTFIYDPSADAWTEGAPMARAREHLNAVALGGFLHALGGRTGGALDSHERYDPTTDSWRTLAPLPTARSAAGVAAFRGKIYVMGGEVPRLFDVNEVYDPLTDRWACAAPMPVPRHGVAAVALDDRILLPAGGVIQGLLPTSHVDSFVPAAEPPTSELVFDRATYRAQEGAGAVEIGILRRGRPSGEASAIYETLDGTAFAGTDYRATSGKVHFGDGEGGRRSFLVELLDDAIPEVEETVRLRLSEPSGAILGDPSMASLAIADDDSDGGRLQVAHKTVVVDEAAGSVTVAVERLGGAAGVASVRYHTEPLSGAAGEDFVSATGLLEWAPGDAAPRTVALQLLDDPLEERSELFALRLSEPVGAALGEPAQTVVVLVDDERPGCTADDGTLCLLAGRFRIEPEWRDPRTGVSGVAGAVAGLDRTGILWFFEPSNFELLVKVIDGRALTGAFWLFYGALSDVEYWIVATDSATGAVRVFHNPASRLASVADVHAFPDAGAGDEPAAEPPRPASTAVPGACPGDLEALCLQGGRFEVRVTWRTADDRQGTGRAIPRTDESGLFWFFGPDNIELAVKVIDGRELNGRYWVFYGALSNVEYTVTVTDTATGSVQEYANPLGTLASVADIEAFSG